MSTPNVACRSRPIADAENAVRDALAAAGLAFDDWIDIDDVIADTARLALECGIAESVGFHSALNRDLARWPADAMTEDQFSAVVGWQLEIVRSERRQRSKRRSRIEIAAIRDALFWLAWRLRPATVRQLFYQAVSIGLVDKTEREYKGTVCRLLGDLRRERALPFEFIADNTRWMRKGVTYDSLEDALRETQRHYRRDLWSGQPDRVEVWLEKEALAGVVMQATDPWHVPLMVTRGYPSLSYVHAAAESIEDADATTHIYYLGDHDPSGVDIPRFVEESLLDLAPGADFTFTRLAVLPEQIAEFGLQTRPTKRTDSRSKSFEGESVEVDAIHPRTLRAMVEERITGHLDADRLDRLRVAEAAERETLSGIIERLTA